VTAIPLFLTLTGTTVADSLAQPDDLLAQNADDITIEIIGLGGNDTLTVRLAQFRHGPRRYPDRRQPFVWRLWQ
jgi:hypothetical protein